MSAFARRWLCAGALLGGAAVLLGAFGAHALRTVLDASALATWHTAVDYQFWHALALLATALLARDAVSRSLRAAARSFAIGSVLFCGSLYALALGAPHWLGVVTPLGGVAFMVGWVALAISAYSLRD